MQPGGGAGPLRVGGARELGGGFTLRYLEAPDMNRLQEWRFEVRHPQQETRLVNVSADRRLIGQGLVDIQRTDPNAGPYRPTPAGQIPRGIVIGALEEIARVLPDSIKLLHGQRTEGAHAITDRTPQIFRLRRPR